MDIQVKKGDALSEASHFIVEDIIGHNLELRHIETDRSLLVEVDYAKGLMKSADYFDEEIEVTKADKKDGTPGIRTIWDNIHTQDVFTVCFKKKDKAKTKTQLKNEIDTAVNTFLSEIATVGTRNAALELINHLVSNPILPYIEGEERILRGYKVQFDSVTGEYVCVDMDLVGKDKNVERLVNVNTISYLIYHGKKYVVK